MNVILTIRRFCRTEEYEKQVMKLFCGQDICVFVLTSYYRSVADGSLADILRCPHHVRFTPESGH